MTRVQITIEDPILGDISVEQDNYVNSFSPEVQRRAVMTLLARANAQIARAYELNDEAAQ